MTDKCCEHETNYFVKWCPVHDGVAVDDDGTLNLIQALAVMEVQRKGSKARMKDWFGESGMMNNDTVAFLYFPDSYADIDDDLEEDFEVFKKIFKFTDHDGCEFEISW